jgi:hypothetical protein
MTKGVTTTRGFVLRNLARCFAAEGGDAAAAFTSVGLRSPTRSLTAMSSHLTITIGC